MVLIIIGVAMLALGVHHSRATRIAPDAVPVHGRVVHVDEKRSSLSGSNRRLFAATVEYRDAATGETRVLRPDAHRPDEVRVGDDVTLMQDPATGELRLPLRHAVVQRALPFVMGALIVALGTYSLLQ